ncbi:MAG: hypothetical protein ACPGRC_07375 [Salibacteraceae bacterium]
MFSPYFSKLKLVPFFIVSAFFLLSLHSQAQNAIGEWCGTSTNTECGACLSDGIMQAQPNARTKTKPRMMYVSDWVKFKSLIKLKRNMKRKLEVI